jgi:REP element-mobilizing transposase RayT
LQGKEERVPHPGLSPVGDADRIAEMKFPGHPKRLDGFPYDQAGPVFHCRLGCLDRKPYLSEPVLADLVVEALRFRHAHSAEIFAFCVMPDHLHLLLSLLPPGVPLSRWVGDLKRWISHEAREATGRGFAWQPNFFEHVVRRDEALSAVARYILDNPVRLHLVSRWQDYRWCGSLAWHLED